MALRVTTAPAVEPVTAAEVKLHSRIDTDADDGKIAMLIEAAREYIESVTGRRFVSTTLTLTLDRFPADDFIELPGAPLQSVTSVKYVDSLGAIQTFSSSSYDVDVTDDMHGRIYVDRSTGWPSVYYQRNAVTIIYKAGHGDTAANVPEKIKQAILLLVGHWYEHREPVVVGTITAELPQSLKALINNLKVRGGIEIYESGLTAP